ncbi:hypothetical protein [Mesobacillus subterraneus]|uniref:hypothetical protein n=1 Tax=Mesobacillus subterraneus TaxID=285983 RepID=UPI000FFF1B8D|nr:hypothetical protein [Mesobacillus subterraneus]
MNLSQLMNAKNLQSRKGRFLQCTLRKNNSQKITFLYLLAILSSGLFYSYATTWLIVEDLATVFLILFLSSIIDMFVFFDVTFFKKVSKVSSRNLTLISIVFLIATLIFSNSNSLLFLVILYVFCTLSFSFHLLSFEQELLRTKNNIRSGLINITLLRNFSKIIGFAIGAWIYKMQLQEYIFILLISFLFFLFINIQPEVEQSQKKISIKALKGKVYIFVLSLLGTTAVFWIPLFVAELTEKKLLNLSSIVFTLPGIVSVAYLNLISREKFDISLMAKNKLHILFLICFGILNFIEAYLIIRIILFSFIVALGISISVEVRSRFMNVNNHIDTKVTLQTYTLISAVSLLIFTLLSIYFNEFPFYLLGLNVVASLIILTHRKEFI